MSIINSINEVLQIYSEEEIATELQSIKLKINELARLNDYSSDKYILLLRENSRLQESLQCIQNLKNLKKRDAQTNTMSIDSDMKELIEIEVEEIKNEVEKNISMLKSLMQKPLENDDKKAIIEIRPGVGGIEASLFAESLYRMYSRYCTLKHKKIELINLEYNDEGGINEAIFLLDYNASFKDFRFESGVHRVQRVPSTESSGRIHTSTASVAILPQFENTGIKINPEELRIDVYRSSGPGGQSVNTTDSAVRITHIPTGITVSCQNSKSQHKNKELALSILSSRLYELEHEKQAQKEKSLRSAAIKSGDRSVKIRTYNFPQGRITDHRVNLSWFNINEVINGDLEEIINQTSEKLRAELV
jgi:peptide chain release factor 1